MTDDDSQVVKLSEVLSFLDQNNLQSLSQVFRTQFSDKSFAEKKGSIGSLKQRDSSWCIDDYQLLLRIIESALDAMKLELSALLFPVFCHLYLDFIQSDNFEEAEIFFNRFIEEQFAFHKNDCYELQAVKTREQIAQSEISKSILNEKFSVTMSGESNNYLNKQLSENANVNLMNLIKTKLNIVVYSGKTRLGEVVESSLGSIIGEWTHSTQPSKILYGINREQEPFIEEEEDESNEGTEATAESTESGKRSKKRPRKDTSGSSSRKPKNTPAAPPLDRIPLPELRDIDRMDKMNAARDALRRVKLGLDKSVCAYCYTLHNTTNSLSSVCFSDDSTLLAGCFESSLVKIWSLTDQPLKEMKTFQDLSQIDLEDESVSVSLDNLLDEKTAAFAKTMMGHRGSVYSCSFAPDKSSIVTASADGTARLWSLYTFSNLVIFKGHVGPVWDVSFSNHGHYFASAGNDQTVRIWSQEHIQPVRIMAGHISAVECVCYHPNSNYVISASADRTIRMWDVLTGECVRVLTGHKHAISCITVHPVTGRFVASGNEGGEVLIHDLLFSNQVICILKDRASVQDPGPIYSLSFDRNGQTLVAGFGNCCLKMWDVSKFLAPFLDNDVPVTQTNLNQSSLPDSASQLMNTFYTKATPVKGVHFTRKNLLLVAGNYQLALINRKI